MKPPYPSCFWNRDIGGASPTCKRVAFSNQDYMTFDFTGKGLTLETKAFLSITNFNSHILRRNKKMKNRDMARTKAQGKDVLDKVAAGLLTPIALVLIGTAVVYFIYESGAKGFYTPKGSQSGQIHGGWKGEQE